MCNNSSELLPYPLNTKSIPNLRGLRWMFLTNPPPRLPTPCSSETHASTSGHRTSRCGWIRTKCANPSGLKNIRDLAADNAEKGRQQIQKLTQEYVQTGKQLARIDQGVDIGQIVQQKALEQPTYYTAFLPNGGIEISWVPAQLDKQYQEGMLELDWQSKKEYLHLCARFFFH